MANEESIQAPRGNALTLWQEPHMLGKVQDALEKYKKKYIPFWKQMKRYIPETYIERLFRQAWLKGYYAAKKEVLDEATHSAGPEIP